MLLEQFNWQKIVENVYIEIVTKYNIYIWLDFLFLNKNHRMGKTRDLFKKTRDTKRIFHTKMSTIKDRNGIDLRETKKIFMTQITTILWSLT